jgi:hypothetical protein
MSRSGGRKNRSCKDEGLDINLRSRLALSISEAAAVVGLSENTFRTVLPEIERVTVGRRVLIPVGALERWLAGRVERYPAGDDTLFDDLLKDIR